MLQCKIELKKFCLPRTVVFIWCFCSIVTRNVWCNFFSQTREDYFILVGKKYDRFLSLVIRQMGLREIFSRRAVIYRKNKVNSSIRTIHTKDIQTSQKRVEWHEAAWVWIKKRGCSRAASQLEPSCLRHCWLSLFLWSYRPIDVPSHGQCDPILKTSQTQK